jgi:hypothetical protein
MESLLIPILATSLLSSAQAQLVAHWSFDSDFLDSTATHNGTAKNGAVLSTGNQGFGGGEALSLNGGSGVTAPHLTVDNPTDFNFNNDFTWHAYVKTTSAAGGIFGRAPATPIIHNQGSKSLFVGGGNAQWDTGWVGAPSSLVPINDDEWHQVIVTFVAATDQLDIFVDPASGATIGQYSGIHDVNRFDEQTLEHNGSIASTSFRIGQVSDNFRSGSIVGLIDEAAIFDVALSGADLDQLIASGPASFLSSPTDPFLLVAESVVFEPISTSTPNPSRNINIRNTGETQSLNLSALNFIGDTGPFEDASQLGTILPGQSDVVVISFAPTTPGTFSTTLQVSSNELSSPRNIGLTIEVVPDPFFSLPNPLTLEEAANGLGALQKSISLTNTGLVQSLDVTAVSFSGPNASLFSNPVLPAAVAPGESGTLAFDFDSNVDPGSYSAVIQITSNAENTPTIDVNLTIDVIESSKGALVAYWNFDQDASDSLGNHDGTFQNGAAVSTGALGFGGGEALSLNGGSGVTAPHVTTANPEEFNFNDDFTWHAYVKTTSAAGGIFGRVPATPTIHNQGSKSLFVGGRNAQWDTGWVGAPSSNISINDDEWHQVIVTFQSETDQLDIFVDPQPGATTGQYSGIHDVNRFDEQTLEHNGGIANSSFRIGQVSDNFRSDSIFGLIDEAAIFNDALNGAQLDQLITSGPASFFINPNIIITGVAVSPDQRTLTLTWNSRPGQIYTVIYSTDLQNWDGDLDDLVLADAGDSTTRAFDIDGLAGPGGQLFVRVTRQ